MRWAVALTLALASIGCGGRSSYEQRPSDRSTVDEPSVLADIDVRVMAYAFDRGDTTTFVPERQPRSGSQEPPCRFELSADWRIEGAPPPSPFHALQVEYRIPRIQRFTIR